MAAEEYELRDHAMDGVEKNDFTPEDVENSIASGYIHKTELDELRDSVGNKKFTIVGQAICGRRIYSVGKIVSYPDGKVYRFISIKCDEANYD